MLTTLASQSPALPLTDATAGKLRLTRQRAEAQQLILNQIKIGHAIRSQRIVYVEDLDEARAEKQEWVARTTDLLKQLFSDCSIAEQCNDWVGPILPEYAEWNLFVEQFVNEMKHRIGRLQTLVKRLNSIPEPHPPGQAEIRPARPPAQQAPSDVPPATPPPTIQWPGLLISRIANDTMRQNVQQFLAKLDLPLQLIDRSAAEGKPTLVEAIGELGLVEFALILNDSAATEGDGLFELGCCVGRFGAQRVCVLHRNPAQQNAPGDTRGVRHIALDDACAWQLLLARHLKSAGLAIDLNRLV